MLYGSEGLRVQLRVLSDAVRLESIKLLCTLHLVSSELTLVIFKSRSFNRKVFVQFTRAVVT